ncbi:hypothetical protein SAVCW2_66880 [Streptomyces avermitilis]|uniref:HTH tetR-type domain-containing protein n=1 Tax=Streptomyces avermitilis TaxID=33903 RepID=A0A499V4K7_STRAX|nr:hypothetical protein SAVMC3_18430 [Streptomyces avermitilis]GDY87489.1 hypothetical protein SAVCW2_66880 [Streptomyces avermitilis]
MQQKKEAPLRSDAQRNRERILEVALAELTCSADAPLSAIAKKAGVGQGTFYRNFPNREALVLEIYRYEMQQVADTAAQLLRTRAPDEALREWMDRLAQFAMAKAGMAEAIRKATSAPGSPAKPGHEPVTAAAALLLDANESAGTIRPGVTPTTSSSPSPASGRSTRTATGSHAPPAFWTWSWTACAPGHAGAERHAPAAPGPARPADDPCGRADRRRQGVRVSSKLA